jgi:hypothetical protein
MVTPVKQTSSSSRLSGIASFGKGQLSKARKAANQALETSWSWTGAPVGNFFNQQYYNAYPEDPKKTLDRISDLAGLGIRRAAVLGVEPGNTALRHKDDLDQMVPEPNHLLHLPPNEVSPSDPEAARATDLQSQVNATNWPKKMEEGLNARRHDGTIFTMLMLMRSWSGLQDKSNPLRDKSNNLLLSLVKRGNEGKIELWNLFFDHYGSRLTLFQKVKAAFAYMVFYQTSLVSRIVKEFSESSVKRMVESLADKKARLALFDRSLFHVNQYFASYIHATRDFAFGVHYPELKDHDLSAYQTRAIESRYSSIRELCEQVSIRRVESDSPKVPFFTSLQQIPLIGSMFTALEAALNHFIRSQMKHGVLPSSLESIVNNGHEATLPDRLPFAIAMTRFMTILFKNFRDQMSKGDVAKPAESPLMDERLVSPTVKHILMALQLKPFATQGELRKKFEELDKEKGGSVVQTILENSLVNGVDALFKYLNRTAESKELFARLFELAGGVFKETDDEETLRSRFLDAQLELERTAGTVFDEIVKKQVAAYTGHGGQIVDVGLPPDETFDTMQKFAGRTLEELDALSDRIKEKVDQPALARRKHLQIQTEVATLLEVAREFSIRKEIRDPMNALKRGDRNEIWHIFTPVYVQMGEVADSSLRLQKEAQQYVAHADIADHLQTMHDLLRVIGDEITHDRPAPTQLIEALNTHAKEIHERLKREHGDVALNREIRAQIDQLQVRIEAIAENQKVIGALDRIAVGGGLLGQLLDYQLGKSSSSGFKPRLCLAEIGQCIKDLPAEEQEALNRLIGNGSNIQSKRNELVQILGRIRNGASLSKTGESAQLDALLKRAIPWVLSKSQRYAEMRDGNYRVIKEEAALVSRSIKELRDQVANAELKTPPFWASGTSDTNTKRGGVALKYGSTLLGGLALGAAGCFAGPVVGAAAAAAGAEGGRRIYRKFTQDKVPEWVLPKIHDVYQKARLFAHDPLLWKGMATRFLSELA